MTGDLRLHGVVEGEDGAVGVLRTARRVGEPQRLADTHYLPRHGLHHTTFLMVFEGLVEISRSCFI